MVYEQRFNIKKIFRHFRTFIRSLMPFLTAHHPMCQYYIDHYFKIGKLKICIGCVITIPTFSLILAYHFVYNIWMLIPYHLFWYVIITLIVFLVLYHIGLHMGLENKVKFLKIVSKVIMGVLLGLAVIYVLSIPMKSYFLNLLFALIVFSLINGAYSSIRNFKIYRTCSRCSQFKEFPLCDGFRDIVEKLLINGFISIEKRPENS